MFRSDLEIDVNPLSTTTSTLTVVKSVPLSLNTKGHSQQDLKRIPRSHSVILRKKRSENRIQNEASLATNMTYQ